MADQSSSSANRGRGQRSGGVGSSYGEHRQFRSQSPFLSFEERLQVSRLLYSNTLTAVEGYSRRHRTEEAAIRYRDLCLRGFIPQGSLDPRAIEFDDVFEVIDGLGWSYTVLHVNPFCPRVVREFISNHPYDGECTLIRGYMYHFTPEVINRLMNAPSVDHSFQWENVDLNEAISLLTGNQCSEWKGFSLSDLLGHFKVLYRVCELNWLPGNDSDSMIKNRLRLISAAASGKKISFGHLVYDQVMDMTRSSDSKLSIIFPNLIYQLLVLQKEIPLLPGDEEPIGNGVCIYGFTGDTGGRRTRRRMN